MSQASTVLAGQDYFIGNASVVRLSARQWVALTQEGIVDV